MTALRIAAFGIFGKSNLGNEATLAAFLANLRDRFPEAVVASIGPTGSTVEAMHGLELIDMEPARVRHRFWPFQRWPLVRTLAWIVQLGTEPARRRRAAARMRVFDALVVPGTGILDDFGQGPLDLPHHLLRWVLAARRRALPVYFLSVGAEPVRGRLTRRILRRAVGAAAYRSYRDAPSKTHAGSGGVPTGNDAVFPDLAFSLPATTLPAFEAVHWPPRRVGLGVMGYYGWNRPATAGERIYQDYLAKIKQFIHWLLARGQSVRLLSGDTRAEERPIRELAQAFGARVIAEPIATYQDLLRQLAETDVVIGSRFHNVLLALLVERPAVSLGYSKKNDSLLEVFGLGAYCQDIETFNVERLQAHLEALEHSTTSPVARIRATNVELRRQLDEQYAQVFAMLAALPVVR